VHLQNTVNFIQALEANDKEFDFIPLPNLGHSFKGDGLVAALMASEDYFARCFAAAPAVTPATQVITYAPGLPAGQPQEGNCFASSLAVWREDAWRCTVGSVLYDPCFSTGEDVICGAHPTAPTVSFPLTLTEPLPAPEVSQDTGAHAWLVELADGKVCEYATGATSGVGDERINYFCPSPDPGQDVVILGDLHPGAVWMAKRAVLTGGPPDPTVLESAEVPIRTVWR